MSRQDQTSFKRDLEMIVEKCKNEPCLKTSFCFQDLSFKSKLLLWLTADANSNSPVGP